MARISYVAVLLLACMQLAFGNDVRIKGEAKLTLLDKDSHTALISFPLAWDHSWRESESWDGVYIFVKYKRKDVNEPWHHAYLKDLPTDRQADKVHRVGGSSSIPAMEFLPVKTPDVNYLRMDELRYSNYPEDGGDWDFMTNPDKVAGLFLYRRKAGHGNIDIPRVTLEWDYTDGDLNLYYNATWQDIANGKIEVSVQAIEMVFVPNGPFYAGDMKETYSFVDQDPPKDVMYVDSDDEMLAYTMFNRPGSLYRSAWVDTLPELYPTGYTGYYMMKYEVSQEQYVNFLNRLTLKDQRKRVYANLDNLEVGKFAFGDAGAPDARNGIVLLEKPHGDTAAVFGFDLSDMDPINGELDGKSIPCNYLTPADVIAYCDWAGLRPHSELEYEKGTRARNPSTLPAVRSFAWETPYYNSFQTNMYNDPGGIKMGTAGKEEESVIFSYSSASGIGRMNGPKDDQDGPVRCGAFADETSDMYKAGASRWGLMEMSGNLAEIYYNGWKRKGARFNGQNFGDGNIWSSVATWRKDTTITIEQYTCQCGTYAYLSKIVPLPTRNKYDRPMHVKVTLRQRIDCGCWNGCCGVSFKQSVTIPWPVIDWPESKESFILRGGSFYTARKSGSTIGSEGSADALAVSYRGDTIYNVTAADRLRFPYSGFRAGRSVPMKSMRTSVIKGGKDDVTVNDTAVICPNSPYTFTVKEPADDPAESTVYNWEMNDGTGWQVIEGEYGETYTETRNLVRHEVGYYHTYKFRRRSIASHAEGYSNEVTVVVPGYWVNSGNSTFILAMDKDEAKLSTYVGNKDGQTSNVSVYWKKKKEAETAYRQLGTTQAVSELLLTTIKRSELDPDIPLGDGAQGNLMVLVDRGGCSDTLELVLQVDVQEKICPASMKVKGRSGKEYALAIGRDGWCWMAEDSRESATANRKELHSSNLYTMNEMVDTYGRDSICPPGFVLPTYGRWNLLMQFYGDDAKSQPDCMYRRFYSYPLNEVCEPDGYAGFNLAAAGLSADSLYTMVNDLNLDAPGGVFTGWWSLASTGGSVNRYVGGGYDATLYSANGVAKSGDVMDLFVNNLSIQSAANNMSYAVRCYKRKEDL